MPLAIADNLSRPRLLAMGIHNGADYINASYVDVSVCVCVCVCARAHVVCVVIDTNVFNNLW